MHVCFPLNPTQASWGKWLFEFPWADECTLLTTSDVSESHGGEVITSGHYAGNLGWHEGLVCGARKPCVTEVFMPDKHSKFLDFLCSLKETSPLLLFKPSGFICAGSSGIWWRSMAGWWCGQHFRYVAFVGVKTSTLNKRTLSTAQGRGRPQENLNEMQSSINR